MHLILVKTGVSPPSGVSVFSSYLCRVEASQKNGRNASCCVTVALEFFKAWPQYLRAHR